MSFSSEHKYFDDVSVGDAWESAGRTITEADIVNFAGLSGDFSPIHVDHEFCKNTAFRRPIAHGLLVMAVSSGLGINNPAMRTLAFLRVVEWHFRAPVFIGDTIRVRTQVVSKEERSRGRRGVITWKREILNQEGKVAQEGMHSTLVEGRRARGGADPAEKGPGEAV
jgi:3-hydroxybutyryl-CoA dehydratase